VLRLTENEMISLEWPIIWEEVEGESVVGFRDLIWDMDLEFEDEEI